VAGIAAVGAHTAAVEVVVAVAEFHTAVEDPVLTADTNLFVRHKGPPAKSGRAFSFSSHRMRFPLFAA
jgi:hypothetical protein